MKAKVEAVEAVLDEQLEADDLRSIKSKGWSTSQTERRQRNPTFEVAFKSPELGSLRQECPEEDGQESHSLSPRPKD